MYLYNTNILHPIQLFLQWVALGVIEELALVDEPQEEQRGQHFAFP